LTRHAPLLRMPGTSVRRPFYFFLFFLSHFLKLLSFFFFLSSLSVIGHVETIVTLANLERRQGDLQRAESVYEEGLKVVDDKVSPYLISHFTKFLLGVAKNVNKARKVLSDGVSKYKDSKLLFSSFLTLEISQPGFTSPPSTP